jgi:hypothetical protein
MAPSLVPLTGNSARPPLAGGLGVKNFLMFKMYTLITINLSPRPLRGRVPPPGGRGDHLIIFIKSIRYYFLFKAIFELLC